MDSIDIGLEHAPLVVLVYFLVRWLTVDGHSVDCHLGRMLLVCHLRRNVINVDTNVDCRLRRIVL